MSRALQPRRALPVLAAVAALGIAGCLSFDAEGNLFFDPPNFASRETFVEDLRNRLENHDPDAVGDFCLRGFEALHGDDPDELARLQTCAAAINRQGASLPGLREYESWLEARMLYFEAAEEAREAETLARRNAAARRQAEADLRAAQARARRAAVETPPRRPPGRDAPRRPAIESAAKPSIDVASLPPLPDTYKSKPRAAASVPEPAGKPARAVRPVAASGGQGTTRGRAYWSRKVARRDAPRRAAEIVPRLERVFRDAGLPSQLAWVAEVESAMDPVAKSPAGAVGLFQLMPATARSLGLSLSPRDQRLEPEANARAAAAYLKALHRRFGSWPLALAAYNAGEGRVSGLCRKRDSRSFDDIADALPTETQMYVPRVLETIRARTGADPDALPPPRG